MQHTHKHTLTHTEELDSTAALLALSFHWLSLTSHCHSQVVQRHVRGHLARRQYGDRLDDLRNRKRCAAKIQARARGGQTRCDATESNARTPHEVHLICIL